MKEIIVIWSEEEFKLKYSNDWDRSVNITYYEHNIEEKFYIIKYTNYE